jgi:hypothetical protein
MLEKEHYCIISGIPGIGKTTLAEILLTHYIDEGFEIVSISDDINEAYSVFNSSKKQVFYYDDFLGQTTLDYKLNKNEDHRLLKFIEMVSVSSDKRFILTTREYILNQAKLKHEKLSHSNFDAKRCVIDIASYTHLHRAKILFNHLYFSDIPKTYKVEILNNKKYLEIVRHPNYSPRIVEWMTHYQNVRELSPDQYIETFILNLDRPLRLWEHAFHHQITEASRCLLLTLFSLPTEVFICYRTENSFVCCSVAHGFAGKRKLTGTGLPSR